MKYLMAVVSVLFAASCSTIKVERDRVEEIRRVAVVGFDVKQEVPPGLEGLFGSSPKPDTPFAQTKVLGFAEERDHSSRMYSELEKQLQKELKWQIKDRRAVADQAIYKKLFEKNTQGLQNRPIVNENIQIYGTTGILDAWPIQRMSSSERQQLCKDLGVDAIVVADINVAVRNGGGLKKLIGAGDFKPQATLVFSVYTADRNEPVWQDSAARGEEEEGTGHMLGITNQKALDQKTVLAAQSAYQKLFARFKEETARK
ncbi:hypothetical protein K2X30_01350 [bacterium]|jgi:hypothetical protein|nr:hypothetical protein [bacterium]